MSNVFYREAAQASFSLQLQALRGLAAATVVVCHIVDRVLDPAYVNLRSLNPGNGGAAVTFFFVLSGLVLGTSLAKREHTARGYASYLIRRLFRIMPLMFVVVSIGGLYLLFIDPLMPYGYYAAYYGHLTLPQFVSGYVGYSMKPLPPSWSIFVELVGSLLLPLMVAAGRSRLAALLCGVMLILFASVDFGWHYHWNFYMLDFFAGLSVLWWGRPLAERAERLDPRLFWAVLGLLFLAFYMPRELWPAQDGNPRYNLVEVAAIVPLIAIVFVFPRRFQWLESRPLRFLGEVSFSLYLTHWFFVNLAFNDLLLLHPSLIEHPLALIIGMLLVLSPLCLWIAALSFRWVEQPGIALGGKVNALVVHRLFGPVHHRRTVGE